MTRYVVTEIEGYYKVDGGGKRGMGLSAHVLDSAYCHRVVFTARTEDVANAHRTGERYGRLTSWERVERVRGLARARAMELNAAC